MDLYETLEWSERRTCSSKQDLVILTDDLDHDLPTYRLTAGQSVAERKGQQQEETGSSVKMVETTYHSLPAGAAEDGEIDGHHDTDNGEHSTLLFKGGSWQRTNEYHL